MLWYKSWLETRSRFFIGLVVLLMLACGTVFEYPQVASLMTLVPAVDTSSAMGRLIKEAADLQRDYRGFVWYQFFRQNLTQMGTLFAVILGSGWLAQPSGAALFTLSLPVSRRRILGVRALTGLGELMLLAVLPSLVIPLLSPAIGQRLDLGEAVIHGACLFVAAAMFFSLAFLLSTVFTDLWRPLLLACAAAVGLAVAELVFRDAWPLGIFRLMSAEAYFRTGQVPWLGLLAGAATSTALLWGAAVNFARQDF